MTIRRLQFEPDKCRYLVEGECFASVVEVAHILLKRRGAKISKEMIRARLKAGASTWDELSVKPAELANGAGPKAAKARREASKREMAELMRDLDRRKAMLKP